MAWESRKGRGDYYTRSRWNAGRVMREYVGGGLAGVMEAARDEQDRADRLRQRIAEREQQAQMNEIDQQIRRMCALSEALLCAELTAAGYHRHNRGEWRRKRGNGEQQDED